MYIGFQCFIEAEKAIRLQGDQHLFFKTKINKNNIDLTKYGEVMTY